MPAESLRTAGAVGVAVVSSGSWINSSNLSVANFQVRVMINGGYVSDSSGYIVR